MQDNERHEQHQLINLSPLRSLDSYLSVDNIIAKQVLFDIAA